MNERFLSKAKTLDTNEWIMGYYYEDSCNNPFILVNPNTAINGIIKGQIKIDPSTLCQCTGFLDKNEKLIFENDVIDYGTDDDCSTVSWDVCELEWLLEDGSVALKKMGSFYSHELEVISNIYDE